MENRLVPPCPRCERTDPVWPVRDFFAFNRDRSDAEYQRPVDFVGLHAANTGRQLEKRLAPPVKPHWRRYGGMVAILLTALYRALLFGFIFAFVVTWLGSVLLSDPLPGSFLIQIGAATAVAIFIPLVMWMRRAERLAEREQPRWQRAFARWSALYYCARCDVVFVPGRGGRMFSPDELPGYLYADAAQISHRNGKTLLT